MVSLLTNMQLWNFMNPQLSKYGSYIIDKVQVVFFSLDGCVGFQFLYVLCGGETNYLQQNGNVHHILSWLLDASWLSLIFNETTDYFFIDCLASSSTLNIVPTTWIYKQLVFFGFFLLQCRMSKVAVLPLSGRCWLMQSFHHILNTVMYTCTVCLTQQLHCCKLLRVSK